VALIITLLFWASAFAAIRFARHDYAAGHLALLRFLVASGVLGAYAFVAPIRLLERRDIPGVAVMAFFGVAVYHVALNSGEHTVPAGTASFLISTSPVFMALMARLFLHERLKLWGWVGIAISFCGVAIIAAEKGGGFRFSTGALLVLLSAFCGSVYLIIQKSYLSRYRAFEITAYPVWIGAFFLLLTFGQGLVPAVLAAPPAATMAIVYLGVFPSALAYVTWAYALSRLPASVVASFLYVMPVLALGIAWLWLGEVPAIEALYGGVLAIAGVALVGLRGR